MRVFLLVVLCLSIVASSPPAWAASTVGQVSKGTARKLTPSSKAHRQETAALKAYAASHGLGLERVLHANNRLRAGIRLGSLSAVRSAIRARAFLDLQGPLGTSPLMRSAMKGQTAIAAALVEAGANTTLLRKQGRGVLALALAKGRCETVERLVGLGLRTASLRRPDRTLLHLAAQAGCFRVVTALVHEGVAVDTGTRSGTTPLMLAAAAGEDRAVRELLAAGAAIEAKDKNGWTPLLHAAYASDGVEAVRVLLEAGADPVTKSTLGYNALRLAIAKRQRDAQALLLRECMALDADDCGAVSAWFAAAGNGHEAVVRTLLKSGFDPDTRRWDGRTALGVAAETNRPLIAMPLIRAGASLEIEDELGWRPLHIAVAAGSEPIVRSLLRAGVEVDAKVAGGDAADEWTPLLLAASSGSGAIFQELVMAGAAIDTTTPSGFGAMHLAAWHGNQKIVSFLLQMGRIARPAEGAPFRPRRLAELAGHTKVLDVLRALDPEYEG